MAKKKAPNDRITFNFGANVKTKKRKAQGKRQGKDGRVYGKYKLTVADFAVRDAQKATKTYSLTADLDYDNNPDAGPFSICDCIDNFTAAIGAIAPREIFEDVYVTIEPAVDRPAFTASWSAQSIGLAPSGVRKTVVENRHSDEASRSLIA